MGIISGLFLWWLSQQHADYKETKKIASLLLTKLRANDAICGKIAKEGEQLKAGDQDVKKWVHGRILPPGDFRTTIFIATISQQGILPKEILERVHYVYYKVWQIDRFRVEKDQANSKPDQKEFFFYRMVEACTEITRVVREFDLIKKLQVAAEGEGIFHVLGF